MAGFDVSGFSGIGFAALTDANTGLTGLYTINTSTTTGINNRATFISLIGDGLLPLRGLTALNGINAVPEPATLAMAGFGLGIVGLAAIRRRAKV